MYLKVKKILHKKFRKSYPWGQFHQRSIHSFYVRKLRVQLFCAYILGLYFTGARLLAQKLRVEPWCLYFNFFFINEDSK